MPQASADTGQYMKLAPANLAYDKSQKTYLKTAQFVRVWS